MANLASYQKITRVLPGLPFGDGSDGALTISSNTTQSVATSSCSGTSASATLTLGAASTFANGDVVLIWQVRGTGVGQWEINRISSGGGTTSLTLQENLQYTYTDSGASQAQVFELKQYTDVIIDSGINWTASAWAGDTGGFLSFATRGTLTFTGNGIATGKGYVGPSGQAGPSFGGDRQGLQGEGTSGAGIRSMSANGNGAGGGFWYTSGPSSYGAGGAGGGHAASGTNGGQSNPGIGGSASGSADLTTLTFGGAGGAGGNPDNITPSGGGGTGGGAVIIFAKIITVTGTVVATGNNGSDVSGEYAGAGGSGAGGSILLITQTATLGTNLITALAGTAGNAPDPNSGDGGTGSVGRIAVHHSGTVTGTTNPSYTDVTDGTLLETSAFFLLNFI